MGKPSDIREILKERYDRRNSEKKKSYGPDEIRAEHRACVDYHTALVNSRFTVIGFYIAALGFLGGSVFKEDIEWSAKATVSFIAVWITFCIWIIELRTRALFTNIVHRGIEIEREYWKLGPMSGFFSRQHKLPADIEVNITQNSKHRMNDPDQPFLGWSKNPLSKKLSRYVSHSMGLDLLFSGLLVFWILVTLLSTFNAVFS